MSQIHGRARCQRHHSTIENKADLMHLKSGAGDKQRLNGEGEADDGIEEQMKTCCCRLGIVPFDKQPRTEETTVVSAVQTAFQSQQINQFPQRRQHRRSSRGITPKNQQSETAAPKTKSDEDAVVKSQSRWPFSVIEVMSETFGESFALCARGYGACIAPNDAEKRTCDVPYNIPVTRATEEEGMDVTVAKRASPPNTSYEKVKTSSFVEKTEVCLLGVDSMCDFEDLCQEKGDGENHSTVSACDSCRFEFMPSYSKMKSGSSIVSSPTHGRSSVANTASLFLRKLQTPCQRDRYLQREMKIDNTSCRSQTLSGLLFLGDNVWSKLSAEDRLKREIEKTTRLRSKCTSMRLDMKRLRAELRAAKSEAARESDRRHRAESRLRKELHEMERNLQEANACQTDEAEERRESDVWALEKNLDLSNEKLLLATAQLKLVIATKNHLLDEHRRIRSICQSMLALMNETHLRPQRQISFKFRISEKP